VCVSVCVCYRERVCVFGEGVKKEIECVLVCVCVIEKEFVCLVKV
jgi:hypothetical protein